MDELLDLLKSSLDLGDAIDSDTPLISSGLVDSLGVAILVTELQSHYGVVIDPEEIGAESFDTPEQILARIRAGGRDGVTVS